MPPLRPRRRRAAARRRIEGLRVAVDEESRRRQRDTRLHRAKNAHSTGPPARPHAAVVHRSAAAAQRRGPAGRAAGAGGPAKRDISRDNDLDSARAQPRAVVRTEAMAVPERVMTDLVRRLEARRSRERRAAQGLRRVAAPGSYT